MPQFLTLLSALLASPFVMKLVDLCLEAWGMEKWKKDRQERNRIGRAFIEDVYFIGRGCGFAEKPPDCLRWLNCKMYAYDPTTSLLAERLRFGWALYSMWVNNPSELATSGLDPTDTQYYLKLKIMIEKIAEEMYEKMRRW